MAVVNDLRILEVATIMVSAAMAAIIAKVMQYPTGGEFVSKCSGGDASVAG